MVCKSRPRWTKELNKIDSLIVKRENEKLLDRDVGGAILFPIKPKLLLFEMYPSEAVFVQQGL